LKRGRIVSFRVVFSAEQAPTANPDYSRMREFLDPLGRLSC